MMIAIASVLIESLDETKKELCNFIVQGGHLYSVHECKTKSRTDKEEKKKRNRL